jgi:hypothetical protein
MFEETGAYRRTHRTIADRYRAITRHPGPQKGDSKRYPAHRIPEPSLQAVGNDEGGGG